MNENWKICHKRTEIVEKRKENPTEWNSILIENTW